MKETEGRLMTQEEKDWAHRIMGKMIYLWFKEGDDHPWALLHDAIHDIIKEHRRDREVFLDFFSRMDSICIDHQDVKILVKEFNRYEEAMHEHIKKLWAAEFQLLDILVQERKEEDKEDGTAL